MVLDVGCGDKPHWRADVMVDAYISHLWYCEMGAEAVKFVAKQGVDFDSQISSFVNSQGILEGLSKVVVKNFESAIIQIWWNGTVKAVSEGEPNKDLMNSIAEHLEHKNQFLNRIVYLSLRRFLRLLFASRLYREAILYNQLVMEPYMSPNDFILRNKVYKSKALID